MTEQKSTTITQLQQSAMATQRDKPPVAMSFFNLDGFELMQRIAKAFSSSDLVPKQYQGSLPNCMIALDMAQRMGANPLQVMQNLYIVHGMPGWSAKFLIATVNTCGRYTSLRYEWRGEKGEPSYGCRAWAIERETGERLDGIWVDWEMVKAEGWAAKSGSKWNTMPDQMFIYRSAAFWQRGYAPELSMGLQTTEEIADTFDASRGRDGAFSVDLDHLRAASEEDVNTETGEIIEPTEKAKPKEKAKPAAEETNDSGDLPLME